MKNRFHYQTKHWNDSLTAFVYDGKNWLPYTCWCTADPPMFDENECWGPIIYETDDEPQVKVYVDKEEINLKNYGQN